MKKNRIFAILLATAIMFTNVQITSLANEQIAEEETVEEIAEEKIENPVNAKGYIENEYDNNTPIVYREELFRASPLSDDSSYNSDIDVLRASYPVVGNQNPYGTCWAFSVASLAMIDMMVHNHAVDRNVDYSELQLAYFMYNSPSNDPLGGTGGDTAKYYDGIGYLNRGGNYVGTIRRLSQWVGLADETTMPYSNAGSGLSYNDNLAYGYNTTHLENAYRISLSGNRSDVKAMIKKHGAVGVSYYHCDSLEVHKYNSSIGAYTYYDNIIRGGGHMVIVVGWDDNFSKDNFGDIKPTSDGAWLCRNSWGTYSDYFWMSYENASLNDSAWVLDFNSANNYDNNYQYDGAVNVYPATYTKVANVFKVKSDDGKGETLKAVSISMTKAAQVGYTIEVYRGLIGDNPTSGTLVNSATTQGRTSYAGYYTIPLNSGVSLNEGEKFSIVVTVDKVQAIDHEQNSSINFEDNGQIIYDNKVGSSMGQSFSYIDGKFRDDYYIGGNYCIKAFTDNDESVAPTPPKEPPKPKYTLSFDANGGSCSVSSKILSEGDTYGNLPTPTRSGYDFKGWWTTKYEGGRQINPSESISQNITVYARWNEKSVNVSYRTHVQNEGWQGFVSNGRMSGTSGKALRLEGININISGNPNVGICYSTHVQNLGWQTPMVNGEMSGTSGQSLRLEAIMIGLTGSQASLYDVYYRVHAQNIGWMGWTKNGLPAGTAGYSYRLEGIQIAVVKAGTSLWEVQNKYGYGISSDTSQPYVSKTSKMPALNKKTVVQYRTHVQNDGWQPFYCDGTMAGTSGRSLRLEGIEVKIKNQEYSGGIRYKTHVQNIGWQDYVYNGAMSGTSGRSLRLEAICIELTGDMAKYYDVYYRVHAQNIGWMGWTKNGMPAGTAGFAYRLEGIQIVLLPKNSSSPGGIYDGIAQDTWIPYVSR